MREGVGRVPDVRAGTWGEELAHLVEELADPGRHDRGLLLLEEGAVEDVTVTRGCFTATVWGSGGLDHVVQVRVRALARDAAGRLFRLLLADPRLLASLLPGLAPADEQGADQPGADQRGADGRGVGHGALRLNRGELTADDVEFVCSCPDPDPVCKHAIALALTVADLADSSPASWLRARGVPLDGLSRGGRALVVVPELPAPEDDAAPEVRLVPDDDPAERYWDGAVGPPVLPAGLRHRPATVDRDPDLLATVFRPLLRARDPRLEGERVARALDGLAAVYAALAAAAPPGTPRAGASAVDDVASTAVAAIDGPAPALGPAPISAGPRTDLERAISTRPGPAATARPPAAATRHRRRPTEPRPR